MLLRVRTRRVIWMALATAVLCQFGLAQAQTAPAAKLEISLDDGRITMDVRDAPLSRVLAVIAEKGDFALDIAGELESKVTASFENLPIERALRRLVGRSSYIIELAPATGASDVRRIARLSVLARGAPRRVETSSTPSAKRGKGSKPAKSTTRRAKRRGSAKPPKSRRKPGSPSS